ncbi:uncharacterized protein LOC122619238 isoform X1 [Drosophila teissieri]|uniref:uncharacterized protein LOC122619238 isoform X1 n=2 Tax=Drosophila teissieri TaxID=7243 RepID=UPI001CBA2C5B|nr:uncharacterized protein LOC122619238 isoform X1 [Drosophila teissieri]
MTTLFVGRVLKQQKPSQVTRVNKRATRTAARAAGTEKTGNKSGNGFTLDMSCQQASRFHSATATATLAKSTATRRIATAAAAATATAIAAATAAAAAATLTPVESIAGKTTSEDTDPYAFTETVAVTPPILFNAQKSRARLTDSNRGSNKRQTAATAAANRNANLVAQLSITAAKAQASLASNNTTTTNFHHVTQSQRQSPALQLQLPLQSQSQSQASPKRATNVCIVRPQQQQLEKIATSESCQSTAAPPPLYAHTPSLWQTPLLIDNGQKQQLLQQQQHQQTQHQQQQSVAIALVSPPTSPASLPSPTLPPATAAVTAMVAPISVSPKGGLPLPPSKFHHTTLAQHLQKVECLKKKKSLPLACQNNNNNSKLQNNNNVVDSHMKPVVQGTSYNQTQPPPLMVFNTGTVAVPAQTPQTAAPQKHSTGNSVDDSDLNEIPVNVIFRKPQEAGGAAKTGGAGGLGASVSGTLQTRPAEVKLVTPLTPPTPPEMSAPPLLAQMQPPQIPTSCVPALATSFKVTSPAVLSPKVVSAPPASPKLLCPTAPASTNSLQIAPKAVPATTTSSAPALAKKSEQMSSKVANLNASNHQAPIASKGVRNGITNNINNRNSNAVAKKPSPTSMPPPKEPIALAANKLADSEHRQRRRKPASSCKRSLDTLSENESFSVDSPYCLQQHWLHSGFKDKAHDPPLSQSNRREERIAVRKGALRRQALQLLSTRSLQELPMRAAKQRLQCVQNMLIKYQDHAGQQQGIGIGNRCLVASCKQPTLSMAAHCERHIVNNSTQQLFQPCVAWRMDGTACQAPVFDVLHTLALCKVHSHLRSGMDGARPASKQPPVSLPVAEVATLCVPVKQQRKRKANTNPVARPQKRGRKPANEPIANQISSQIGKLISATGMQRKSSTTSLESIASNSHSSATSHSQPPYKPANVSAAVPAAQNLPQQSIPPALAPLSTDFQPKHQQHEPLLVPKLEVDSLFKFDADQQQNQQQQSSLDPSLLSLDIANIKAEEISQIVAQLAAAGGDLQNPNNNNNISIHNNNSVHFNNNNNMNYSNNNNNSFPSFNTAFGNAIGQPTNTITHNGPAVPAILANTADLLGQDMFGICENSSAYASSEDTGLGGLSESELIGANDADDIALNGAHLLEEHDLVNVFDTLSDDAFNELFQSVQQAECEAMDRALDRALQQTMGGSADSAFLNDFLDVGDDLLADAVMHSPNTSGIDAPPLFGDSSSGGGNSSSNGASDIRGLVQT